MIRMFVVLRLEGIVRRRAQDDNALRERQHRDDGLGLFLGRLFVRQFERSQPFAVFELQASHLDRRIRRFVRLV